MYSLPCYHETLSSARLPEGIVYNLPSYHTQEETTAQETSPAEDFGEKSTSLVAEEIARRQLQLIDEVNSYIDRINSALATHFDLATERSVVTAPKQSPAEAAKSTKEPSAAVGPFSYSQRVFESKEIGQTIRACAPPVLANFAVSSMPKMVTLTVGKRDASWVQMLSSVGAKRGVQFIGDSLKERVSSPICSVTVHFSPNDDGKVEAKVDNLVVIGRLAVNKLMGSMLGLYPTEPEDASQATHTDRWLFLADRVLSNNLDSESACRSLSSALSGCDLLANTFCVSLADIIALASVSDQKTLPNNVELWKSRVIAAMS